MILSHIDNRKVPREVLKTSGFVLGFQHFPRDHEWIIRADPHSQREQVLSLHRNVSISILAAKIPSQIVKIRRIVENSHLFNK